MKRYVILFILSALATLSVVAQSQNLTVTSLMGSSVETILQQHLQGEGVIISGFPGYDFLDPATGQVRHAKFNNQEGNVTYPQIGTFNRNGFSTFPFSTGLVLTTGNVSVAAGPNNSTSASSSVTPYYTETSLNAYTGGYSATSSASLEFDFIAMADTFCFNYIFGSEEYCEFVNTSFNDVFAFMLTGIDPVTYQTTTKNVAVVPGSVTASNPNGTPVAINNVNHGNHSSGSSGPGTGAANPSYFICNYGNSTGVQYDGYTTALAAQAVIFACQTYHMKLAVANVSDQAYDSGVFLEEGSFYSPHVEVSQAWETEEGGDTLMQNCRDLDLTFKIERPMLTSSTSIVIDAAGTAQLGQDYTMLKPDGTEINPDENTFFYPEGDTIQLVHVSMSPTAHFPDGVDTKTIILYVTTQGCTGNGLLAPFFHVEDTIYLYLRANDSIRLRDTAITVCDHLDYIEVEQVSGTSPTFYQWISATGNPDPAGILDPESLSTACDISESTHYKVIARDRWNCMKDTADVHVTIVPKPEFDITYTPDHGCQPLTVTLQAQYQPDYSRLYWTINNDSSYVYEDSATTLHLSLPDPGYYDVSLLVESAPGCADSLTYSNVIHVSDFPHADFVFSPSEPENGEEVFFYNLSTGENITNFVWNFGDGHSSYVEEPSHAYHLTESDLMTVRFTVTNSDGCSDDTIQVVPVEDNFAFFVPSGFTPNDDGKNDVFLPKVNDVVNYELVIYTRTGELIFYTTNPEEGWDGFLNGKPAPEGVYVWQIHYAKIGTPDEMMVKRGSVTLVR
jgi:gliding motility-associated-like protein